MGRQQVKAFLSDIDDEFRLITFLYYTLYTDALPYKKALQNRVLQQKQSWGKRL